MFEVEENEFFAPVSSDLIDGLLAEYQGMRKKLEEIAQMINGEMSHALAYFFDGNRDPDNGRGDRTVAQTFRLAGAIGALNAAYWSKTLAFTDVLDCMPQKRRDEWHNQLRYPEGVKSRRSYEKSVEWEIEPLPDFTEEAVRPTIAALLNSRQQFFSERVDGIFRGLSGEHVTNAPEAFGKRMIMGYMLSYGSISHSKAGLINDLRAVIAKFMGRDEPKYNSSSKLMSELYRNTGEWHTVDGGALRIRVYKKGTAHLEVHPDIAWRLNQVLSYLHPMAIPAQFRQKPKKKAKEFTMMGRPLPFAVLELLCDNCNARYRRGKYNDMSFRFTESAKKDKVVHQQAIRVLMSIGGVMNKDGGFDFDYNYDPVIDSIILSGCVPDEKSHQFYPTPASVGAEAVAMADIGPGDICLEPSAGQGDLAALMPADRTTCVEISPLHCAILKARGLNATEADFIKWAQGAPLFDRVVMNPPFSEGRAKAHVEAAAALVKPGGRLVAILPASFKGKDVLPGWELDWSTVYSNEFEGTSVSVVIVKADKKS